MDCATKITCVTGRWNTLLDASQYRVDSRLVTIMNKEASRLVISLVHVNIFTCFQLSGWSMTAMLSVFVTY